MLSFRLFVTEQNRGGLNLYATKPGAFTEQSTATGSIFAAYASMALLAAARHDQANHLIRALDTSREIGVGMGILMANGRLTGQQAFDQLRTVSNDFNRKLRDIAADVAVTGLCRMPRSSSSATKCRAARPATLLDRPDLRRSPHPDEVTGV